MQPFAFSGQGSAEALNRAQSKARELLTPYVEEPDALEGMLEPITASFGEAFATWMSERSEGWLSDLEKNRAEFYQHCDLPWYVATEVAEAIEATLEIWTSLFPNEDWEVDQQIDFRAALENELQRWWEDCSTKDGFVASS